MKTNNDQILKRKLVFIHSVLFLTNFNQNWNESTNICKNPKCEISLRSIKWEQSCSMVFHNYVFKNVPKRVNVNKYWSQGNSMEISSCALCDINWNAEHVNISGSTKCSAKKSILLPKKSGWKGWEENITRTKAVNIKINLQNSPITKWICIYFDKSCTIYKHFWSHVAGCN